MAARMMIPTNRIGGNSSERARSRDRGIRHGMTNICWLVPVS